MAKKCLNCKAPFIPKHSSLEKYCQLEDCIIKYALATISNKKLSDEKKKKQEWSKEKIIMKEKLKTLTEWHNDLQKEINSIIREIDKEHPCISSQRDLGKSYDAGHLFSRASNPQIRYHLFNIFAQSVHDNQWKSGNQLEFVDGIELTFGKEIKDYCISLKGANHLKLTIEDIREKIPIARSVLKWLKLQNRKFTTQERIDYRHIFNEKIGIYNF